MKKCVVIVIALFLLIVPIASCSSADLLPKALAAATANTVGEAKDDSADVFEEIQRNIDLVIALKTKIQDTQLNKTTLSLDDVTKDIEKVTQSYERLCMQRDDISKGLLQKITNVEKMRAKVDEQVSSLRQKQANYNEQLRLVNDSDPEIARTRKEALSQAIKYIDAQILLWQNFNNLENDIVSEMVNIQKTLDSFLSVIDSSALLFREGLNLLSLQRDINNALSLFNNDLPKIQQLTQDMEKSWSILDSLIQTLISVSAVEVTK